MKRKGSQATVQQSYIDETRRAPVTQGEVVELHNIILVHSESHYLPCGCRRRMAELIESMLAVNVFRYSLDM